MAVGYFVVMGKSYDIIGIDKLEFVYKVIEWTIEMKS